MTNKAQELEEALEHELGKVIFGADAVVHALTIALVGRGHVLLEGAPGLGKTLLAKTFAAVLGGSFKRVQGTADLLPTDITGVHVFDAERRAFEFQPGPLFADVLLTDEINRASPKTQSALLEAMEERQVTVDRETFPLPEDFIVVATQNPREFEGTYPLPESQLDRFMLSVPIGYPGPADEARIIEAYGRPQSETAAVSPLPREAVHSARQAAGAIHVAGDLTTYLLDLAAATRNNPHVNLGLSTRGVVALTRAARIEAALAGADYVTPDHVRAVAPWVLGHRLVLSTEAALDGVRAATVVAHVLENVAVPQ
ncbi:MAG: MoxR family ATPase [Pseudomonadales bacterium]|jgi:MoxR-like ATPase